MPTALGAHRWIPLPAVPVPELRVRQDPADRARSAAFVVDRSRRLRERRHHRPGDAAGAAAGAARDRPARPRHRAGVRDGRLRGPVLRRAPRGGSSRRCSRCSSSRSCSCSPWRRRLGVHVLKPYQVQRLTGFLNPSQSPQGATLQHRPVADRDRLRAARPDAASQARTRRASASCPSTRRTSSSRSSARPTGSPGPRSCYRSTRY